jgi:hypothetical protein
MLIKNIRRRDSKTRGYRIATFLAIVQWRLSFSFVHASAEEGRVRR